MDLQEKEFASFFITAMHLLARQAAEYFSNGETKYLKLEYYSSTIPSGSYAFSIYAWKYTGFTMYTKVLTICENGTVAAELPDILENASSQPHAGSEHFDWSVLEEIQVNQWMLAQIAHRQEVETILTFKLESLANNQRGRIRSLEQQIQDTSDDLIRRMRMSELETVQENYEHKANEVQALATKADIYTTLLVNGVVTIREE